MGSSCAARVSELRTKECDFESVVGQVYSEDDARKFIGERWEVVNLPLSWSKVVVQAFLAGWSCTAEASFRAGKVRSAIVGSAEPPPHRRLQHDFHPARGAAQASTNAGLGVVWSKPGKTTEESQKTVRFWASAVGRDPKKAAAVPVFVQSPEAVKRPLAGGESKDTKVIGAISPTLMQDCNQTSTQVLLSPRSRRLVALQPPPVPVLADIAPQLQVRSWRRCSRLRLLSDSSGASCSPSRLRSRR